MLRLFFWHHLQSVNFSFPFSFLFPCFFFFFNFSSLHHPSCPSLHSYPLTLPYCPLFLPFMQKKNYFFIPLSPLSFIFTLSPYLSFSHPSLHSYPHTLPYYPLFLPLMKTKLLHDYPLPSSSFRLTHLDLNFPPFPFSSSSLSLSHHLSPTPRCILFPMGVACVRRYASLGPADPPPVPSPASPLPPLPNSPRVSPPPASSSLEVAVLLLWPSWSLLELCMFW